MNKETFLLLMLFIFLIGALPFWSYSNSWGYQPMGVFSFLLVVFIIWAIAGGRPFFKNKSGNIETKIKDAGREIKSAGRDVADSIRDTVK